MKPETNNQNIQLEDQQEKLLNTPISQASPLWFSKRLFVAVFMAVCQLNSTFIRSNVSIAIVEMAYPKQIIIGNSTETQPPEFDLDSTELGLILSVFFCGGLVSLLGSYMVSKLGGANCLALTMILSGIITVLNPISLQYNFYLFLVCRFIVGFSESLLSVSVAEVSSQWTPNNERSKLVAITASGITVGLTIVHAVCASVAYAWGWQMIFYATGGMSLITSLFCLIFIKNRPSDDKTMSKAELTYIQERIATVPKKEVKHPYKKIILSAAVWAILANKFAMTASMTFLCVFLPMYVKDITQRDINEVGMISSIPNALNIFMLPICGIFLDYGKNTRISVTLIHKIIIGGSFILISILFASTAMLSNFIISIITFLLVQILLLVIGLTTQIIIISIAPNSTSIIAGLCTAMNALGSTIVRNMIASMTDSHAAEEWNRCILVISGISLLGGAIVMLWGSSDVQSWSFVSNTSTKPDEQENQIRQKVTE
ncbi:vesicular glutamate transporter 2-like [Planococcus citri]|uniref:vesicular glutamate transporter 2-like n=1 Tax=Planococcus citri TaxID=170843 RepID=UPI0031F81258